MESNWWWSLCEFVVKFEPNFNYSYTKHFIYMFCIIEEIERYLWNVSSNNFSSGEFFIYL
jgi:hypothetical protein